MPIYPAIDPTWSAEDRRVAWFDVRTRHLFNRAPTHPYPRGNGYGVEFPEWYSSNASGIKLRILRLPSFDWLAALAKAEKRSGGSRGGPTHCALADFACAWMMAHGGDDARTEVATPVGRADAYSARLNMICEAGQTDRDRLLAAAALGYRFALFPYRHNVETTAPLGVEFVMSKDVRDAAQSFILTGGANGA